MSGLEIIAVNSSGDILGSGPITTATQAESTTRLSLVGEVRLTVPATDPATAILDPSGKPFVRILGEREMSVVEVGYGRLLDTDLSIDDKDERTYKGPDQLGLLNNRTVGRLKLSNGSGGPQVASTVLATILAFTPGWTAVGEPSRAVYQEYAMETAFAALVKVAEQTNDSFWLSGDKEITWQKSTDPYPSSGLVARSDVDPVEVESNPDILLIDGEVTMAQEFSGSGTRIYPEGSGNRGAATNVFKTTRFGAPGNGATGDYTSGDYTLHIEHSHADLCYISYDPGETTPDDIVEVRKDYKDIGAAGTLTADEDSASDALFDAAYADLQRMVNPAKTYRFKVAKASVDLVVGSTIILDVQRYVQIIDDTAYFKYADILETCRITEIVRAVDEAGQVQIDGLTVTPNDRPVLGTTTNVLASIISQVQDLSRHYQKAEEAMHADAATTADLVDDADVAYLNAAQTWTADQAFAHIGGDLSIPPSVAPGPALGTGGLASMVGTDVGGTITVTVGTTPIGNAVVATVTFGTSYGAAALPSSIVLSPAGANANALTGNGKVWAQRIAGGATFTLRIGATALVTSGIYSWSYVCVK